MGTWQCPERKKRYETSYFSKILSIQKFDHDINTKNNFRYKEKF